MVEISNVVLYCWTSRTYHFIIFSWTIFLWQPFVRSTLWSPYSAVSVASIKRRSGSFPAQFECHVWGQAAAPVGPSSEFCNVIAFCQSDLPCALSRFMWGIQLHPFLWWWICHRMSYYVMSRYVMQVAALYDVAPCSLVYICASVLKFLLRERRHKSARQ